MLPLALFLAMGHSLSAEPEARAVGHLDLLHHKVAVGPVHADWPLFIAAEILPASDMSGQKLAERFASPPELEPPNGSRPRWRRKHGFYLCGPMGHPDDCFDLAEVVRDGRKLTVTIEGWATGRPIATDKACRPARIVSVQPLLDSGEYEMTVLWREFAPSTTTSSFWSLKSVRRATTMLTVHEGDPPTGARLATVAAGDFRAVPFDKAEDSKLWAPVPTVERVMSLSGFDGLAKPGVGVAAGTFDPRAWKDGLYSHLKEDEFLTKLKNGKALLARPAPVGPAKPTDPLYAVVYGQEEINGDHLRVRAIEWADGGYVLHVQFFHTGWVSGSNFNSRSGYVVQLPTPAGRKPLTGKVPVTVQWSVLHGSHYLAAFRPLGPDDALPIGHGFAIQKATEKNPRPVWMDKGSRTELTIQP